MATKAAVAAVETPAPTEDDIASMGCWPGPAGDAMYVTRKDFMYNGQPIPRGIELRVDNARVARKLIKARLLLDPKELT